VKTVEENIPVNADVYCADGLCGQSKCVVINPVNRQVTHLVVQERGLWGDEHMVAVDQVIQSTPELIRLRCTRDELASLRPFVRGEHVPGEVPFLIYEPTQYVMWPYVMPNAGLLLAEHDHIPPGELAVHRGTQVNASDGHIGRVDEFLVDPANGYITHLVLREGHLWGQKDVTIPVSQIERITEDTVYLKLDKKSIEALPVIPVRRGLW
jgi:sporulation protein YlmC with PRC-barrel domain